MILIQEAPFTIEQLTAETSNARSGAQVIFVGSVRDYCTDGEVAALEIEHYPGMTEKSLQSICDEAESRWPIHSINIIHRVGLIRAGEPIVGVEVLSAHRAAAFEANEFIMDFLKLRAPFWKKEIDGTGSGQWVAQKQTDLASARRWSNS
jgi:molybdopterin synthase catalytic subunit